MKKQTVLVTGCSDGGIGCALAHAFHARGFHIFATARDQDKMASFMGKPDVTLLALDVTDDGQVAAAAKAVGEKTGGRLDYLVNNAAHNHFMPLLDEDIGEVRDLFETNVLGPLRVIKALTPFVINAKGTVVSITSISGYINMPWMGSYAATKRSLEIMTETLRLELQPFGVRVLSLVTGAVETNGLTYFDDFALPPDSIYASIEAIIRGRAHGAGRPAKLPTADEYAAKVTPSIIDRRSGVVWGPGAIVAFVRFAVAWLSPWMTDAMWRKGTGLSELAENLQKRKQ